MNIHICKTFVYRQNRIIVVHRNKNLGKKSQSLAYTLHTLNFIEICSHIYLFYI